jgi:hypothetical protein
MANKGPQGRLGATDSGPRPREASPSAPRNLERLPGPCWRPGRARKGWGFCSALSASGVATGRAGRTANALARSAGWHLCAVPVLRMKPGDFALGSSRSRAAARAALESRFATRKRIDVVCSIPRPGGNGGIRIGPWIESPACLHGNAQTQA